MQARTIALISAAAVLTFTGAIFLSSLVLGRNPLTSVISTSGAGYAQCIGGAVAGDIGGPFTLVDATGATVTDADIVTQPTILYFGYTFCPDVCPLDNMRNAQAVEILEERGIMATPVFVSVDPERDTPEVVGLYAENFHDRMIGLTGSQDQVSAAASAFRVYYNRHEAEPGDSFYLVDHTSFSYILMPGRGFVDFVRRSETPEGLADRISCLVQAGA